MRRLTPPGARGGPSYWSQFGRYQFGGRAGRRDDDLDLAARSFLDTRELADVLLVCKIGRANANSDWRHDAVRVIGQEFAEDGDPKRQPLFIVILEKVIEDRVAAREPGDNET